MTIEFTPFPKLARLNRGITISEKLDGTNAAVVIVEHPFGRARHPEQHPDLFPDHNRIAIIADRSTGDEPDFEYHVYAQSRNRLITPSDDNYGFARWVQEYADELVTDLGPGTHFGEWWGNGIQRGYGLGNGDKRFSLFNSSRWSVVPDFTTPGLGVVPVLYEGPFSQSEITRALWELELNGSRAANFDKPEGIVIWHEAARVGFKVTLVGDEAPKGGVRNEHDVLVGA